MAAQNTLHPEAIVSHPTLPIAVANNSSGNKAKRFFERF